MQIGGMTEKKLTLNEKYDDSDMNICV